MERQKEREREREGQWVPTFRSSIIQISVKMQQPFALATWTLQKGTERTQKRTKELLASKVHHEETGGMQILFQQFHNTDFCSNATTILSLKGEKGGEGEGGRGRGSKQDKRTTYFESLPWRSWRHAASLAHAIISSRSWLRTSASSGRTTDLKPSVELCCGSPGMLTQWAVLQLSDKCSCGCTKRSWSDFAICFVVRLHGTGGLFRSSCLTSPLFCKCRLLSTTRLCKLVDAAGFLTQERKPFRLPAETWPPLRRVKNWFTCGDSVEWSLDESVLKDACCTACILLNFPGFKLKSSSPSLKILPWSKIIGLLSPTLQLWPDSLVFMSGVELQFWNTLILMSGVELQFWNTLVLMSGVEPQFWNSLVLMSGIELQFWNALVLMSGVEPQFWTTLALVSGVEPQFWNSESSPLAAQGSSPSMKPEWGVAEPVGGQSSWVASLWVAGGDAVEAGDTDCGWEGAARVTGIVTRCRSWMQSSMASFSSSSM